MTQYNINMPPKNTTHINEDNLPSILTDLYAETKSYELSYSRIKKLVEQRVKKEKYCSIQDNYDSIFIYEMIERQIPIAEYKNAIKHLSIKSDVDLSRFFVNDYEYDKVFKNGIKIKSSSIWNNMAVLFIDVQNKNSVFDDDNLKYLLPLIEYVTSSSIRKFHEARLTSRMSFILGNEDSNNCSIAILKKIKENPIFEKELALKYPSFFNGIISYLSNHAYEWSEKQLNNALFCLNEAYPNNKERITNYLIKKDKHNNNRLKIELSSKFFTPYLGAKEFIKNLQTAFDIEVERNKERPFDVTDLLQSIKIDLSIEYEKYNHFKEMNFNELININDAPFIKNNYIAIVLLELASKNNAVNIEPKITQKLLSLIKDDHNYSSNDSNMIYQHYVPNNYTEFKSYLEYNSLNNSIIKTDKKKNKLKI